MAFGDHRHKAERRAGSRVSTARLFADGSTRVGPAILTVRGQWLSLRARQQGASVGQRLAFECRFRMDSGRYDVYPNGVKVVADRANATRSVAVVPSGSVPSCWGLTVLPLSASTDMSTMSTATSPMTSSWMDLSKRRPDRAASLRNHGKGRIAATVCCSSHQPRHRLQQNLQPTAPYRAILQHPLSVNALK